MAKHTTHIDAIDIYEKLKTVVTRLPEGRAEYIDKNITDHTVGKDLGVPGSAVARIRAQKFGNLVDKQSNMLMQLRDAIGRIEALEHEVSDLKHINETLTHRVNDQAKLIAEGNRKHDLLCTQLSVSRVSDVRHLAINQPNAKQATF